MSYVHAFPPCIRAIFNILVIFEILFGAFLIVSFFSLSILFMLVVSMEPKRKSTPSQNPLRSGASSSSNPTPSHIQFRDEDALKDFSENFSRRGVHLKRPVIFVDFTDTNLLDVIHSQGWKSLCEHLCQSYCTVAGDYDDGDDDDASDDNDDGDASSTNEMST